MDPAATDLSDSATERGRDDGSMRSRSGSRVSRDPTEVPSVVDDVGMGYMAQDDMDEIPRREEKGIRRIIYHFTPSYACLVSIS